MPQVPAVGPCLCLQSVLGFLWQLECGAVLQQYLPEQAASWDFKQLNAAIVTLKVFIWCLNN